MKSWKKPTPDEVSRAIVQLAQEAHRRYFFDRLSNPEWIQPLREKGMFRDPPKPIRDEANGTIALPPWPQARYLARMAALASELVRDVILEIPDDGNVSIYEDFADAVAGMPPKVSASLIEKVKKWAQAPYQFTLSEKLAKLAVHLASGGQQGASLEILRSVLQVLPDRRKRGSPGGDEEITLPPEPTSRIDLWRYEQILTKSVPEVVGTIGLNAVSLLCDLLEDAVRLSQRDPAAVQLQDLSYFWRRAIEDHEQNSVPTLKSLLVSAVRDAAAQAAQKDPSSFESVLGLLEERAARWRIFTRLVLHLLSSVPSPPAFLVSKYLTDRELFDGTTCRHEYVLLLRSQFRNLNSSEREQILTWIEAAPNPEYFKHRYQEHFGKELPDDEALRNVKVWQRDWLARLGDSIPEEWKPRLQELVAETGAAEHPDFPSYTSSFVGPSSPKSRQELSTMSVRNITEFLRAWQPSNRFMGASREGMGRELSSRATEQPQRFASEAPLFLGTHPTYVRSLVNGLAEAVRHQKQFDWAPVLRLCLWALEQKDEKPATEAPYWVEEDKDWTWTRTAIADLIESALRQQSEVIPFDLQSAVWSVLQKLSDDPNPTPEHEERYGGSDDDPVNRAINTTRGVAMLAITYYATWLRKNIGCLPDGKDKVLRGFQEMPGVREVLEKHLNPEVDPSLGVRSIYGMRFPWLHLVDPMWASNIAERIFPTDVSQRQFWEAAWGAYLAYCNPYDDVLGPLMEQYRIAIERLGEPHLLTRKSADPEAQLAAHFMGYYWRGRLSIEGSDGLIRDFFAKAPDKARAYALETVGRWLFQLAQAKQSVEASVQKRLIALWEWRYSVAQKSPNVTVHAAEAAAFGWWFRSGTFDSPWAISELEKALVVASSGTPSILAHGSYAILEPLAAASHYFPLKAIRCLDLMCGSGSRASQIFFSSVEVRPILENAIKAGGESAQMATTLINELGRRGIMQYRDLLSKN